MAIIDYTSAWCYYDPYIRTISHIGDNKEEIQGLVDSFLMSDHFKTQVAESMRFLGSSKEEALMTTIPVCIELETAIEHLREEAGGQKYINTREKAKEILESWKAQDQL